MSKRLEQIESVLKRAISTVLAHGLSDPRVTGLVSVTRVKVSPDLHDACIYVSVLPGGAAKRTLAGLRHAAIHIHTRVCEQVVLRTVPRLDFRLDKTIVKQVDVLASIQRGLEREQAASGISGTEESVATEETRSEDDLT